MFENIKLPILQIAFAFSINMKKKTNINFRNINVHTKCFTELVIV